MAEQGTEEWLRERMGKVTASKISDVMMDASKAGYQNYRAQLVCERLTGQPTKTFKSRAMEQGNEVEPQARAVYSLETGLMVEEVGFIPHPTIEGAGCSPDGLVGPDGMVQLKCPEPKTHIEYLMGKAIPRVYALQLQWEMACTGRMWTDFSSYNNDLPEEMRIKIIRVNRDPRKIVELEVATRDFLTEVEQMVKDLKSQYGGQ